MNKNEIFFFIRHLTHADDFIFSFSGLDIV